MVGKKEEEKNSDDIYKNGAIDTRTRTRTQMHHNQHLQRK